MEIGGRAWEGLKKIVQGLWKELTTILTTPFRLLGGVLNGMIGDFLNFVGSAKNCFSNFTSWLKGSISGIGNSFSNAWNSIKQGFNNIWNNLVTPHIKMPHINISYSYSGFAAEAAKVLGLPGFPKFNVSWYKNGGVFGEKSIIGVGEYTGAGSNPEIVAPQNLIYQTTAQAYRDVSGSTQVSEEKTSQRIIINVGNRKMFDDFIDYAKEQKRKNGVSVLFE